jgi:hypothetical protein
MKKILSLLILSLNFSAMANEIKCSGETTDASIVLGLTGKVFPLEKADYSFKEKVISTSGYEFSISSNKDDGAELLTYKFKTLKKHSLAKKNSNLVLTIKQVSAEVKPYIFILNETNEAELKVVAGGLVTLIDKMNCKQLSRSEHKSRSETL